MAVHSKFSPKNSIVVDLKVVVFGLYEELIITAITIARTSQFSSLLGAKDELEAPFLSHFRRKLSARCHSYRHFKQFQVDNGIIVMSCTIALALPI